MYRVVIITKLQLRAERLVAGDVFFVDVRKRCLLEHLVIRVVLALRVISTLKVVVNGRHHPLRVRVADDIPENRVSLLLRAHGLHPSVS